MANLALIALGVGGALLLLSGRKSSEKKSGLESVSGLPTTTRVSYQVKENPPLDELRIGPATILLDGQPVKRGDLERSRQVSRVMHDVFALRRTALPAGTNLQNTDNHSKELYWGPSWLIMYNPDKLNAGDLQSAVNGVPFDEFGRTKEGNYGDGPKSLWDQTLGGLLKNPLFAAVATAAVLAAPGGIAVYGAYTLWQMKGQDLSAQNLALQAGRSYVTAQCGAACGMAFDMGVGVVSGQPVDRAAENALIKQMSPAERKAYDDGKRVAREVV